MRKVEALRGHFHVSICLLAAMFCCVSGRAARAAWADGEIHWVWTKGSDSANQAGIYGTPGVADNANTPGARDRAAAWIDGADNLWLFGGWGHDSEGNGSYLNDLWRFEPANGNWTWVNGGNVINQRGIYGTRGTPSADNNPGARTGAATWKDKNGAFWLFGGYGRDGRNSQDCLNDLWKYVPATGLWTWIKGGYLVNEPGIYGTRGLPAEENTPGARAGAVSWTDFSGNLWLFGGYYYDGENGGMLNDLWKYDPSTGNWTWMKGSSKVRQQGVYSLKGTPAPDNTPGARLNATGWVDASGALWLFGGRNYDGDTGEGNFNDLWRYDLSTGNWTWVNGANTPNQPGKHGTTGEFAEENTPCAREDAAVWTDPSGALWLYGGSSYFEADLTGGTLGDLWKCDTSTGHWAFMKGSDALNVPGTYGEVGVAAQENTPGAVSAAAAWADSGGVLWFFGGTGYDAAGSAGDLNSLWRVRVMDRAAPTGTVVINGNRSVTNDVNVTLSLTWSDGDGSGAVRMKFSNDAVTWTDWEPLSATRAWTLPSGEGYHTVRVMFRDKAGNNSAVYKDYIRVDTVPPTGSIIINGGALSTKSQDVSLDLTWDDGRGSGAWRMRFSIDGANWSYWEPLATPRAYTLPEMPGYYTVRVQYLDAGNNYSSVFNDYIKLVTP